MRTPPRTAQLVFEPAPGMFDEVTWPAPHLQWVRLATVGFVALGVVVTVLTGNWTAAVPPLGCVLGDVAATRSPNAVRGAGPAGLDAGRFAIPWDRVSRIDERGHAHLDPPARMSS